MMQDTDRCVSVTIPFRLAGIVLCWTASWTLLLWRTFLGGPQAALAWGIWFAAVAATMTVIHHLTAHHRMMRQAFELGREVERSVVSSLR